LEIGFWSSFSCNTLSGKLKRREKKLSIHRTPYFHDNIQLLSICVCVSEYCDDGPVSILKRKRRGSSSLSPAVPNGLVVSTATIFFSFFFTSHLFNSTTLKIWWIETPN
jgi:hypothetical protein